MFRPRIRTQCGAVQLPRLPQLKQNTWSNVSTCEKSKTTEKRAHKKQKTRKKTKERAIYPIDRCRLSWQMILARSPEKWKLSIKTSPAESVNIRGGRKTRPASKPGLVGWWPARYHTPFVFWQEAKRFGRARAGCAGRRRNFWVRSLLTHFDILPRLSRQRGAMSEYDHAQCV